MCTSNGSDCGHCLDSGCVNNGDSKSPLYEVVDFGPCSFCGQGNYQATYDPKVERPPLYGCCTCCGAS